ncbi:MAG: M48 family metalloprotease [Syntrophobacterales bacterium]|nr:MAG: M48 family metalloprotease [Syntrophobacterales bacterium]
MRFRRSIALLMIILSVMAMIWGCAVNPVTQKPEIMIYSDAAEVEMGRKAHLEVTRQYGEYEDPKLQRFVNDIGQSIAKVSHRPTIQYQYMVLDKQFINAFALPGGYVYITRGLLAHLNSEAELAGVLGHETGHITGRHGMKRLQKAMASQFILAGVAIATESSGIVQGSSILLTAALQTYSRRDEHQADEIGTLYAFKAGYDSKESTGFLKTLKKMDKTTPSAVEIIFRTHPLTEDRIERVNAQSHELSQQSRGADLKIRSSEYISQLDGLVFGPGEKDGIIQENIYRNKFYRFSISAPAGWKIKRGEAVGSVMMKHPTKEYYCQMLVSELESERTSDQFAQSFEAKSGLKRVSVSQMTISGSEALFALYYTKSREGIPLAVEIAYVVRKKTGFMVVGITQAPYFDQAKPSFRKVMSSFRFLTKAEAERIPIYRLKVYTVKEGDTYRSISKRFYGTPTRAGEIMEFNGMTDESSLRPGMKLKIKPTIKEG